MRVVVVVGVVAKDFNGLFQNDREPVDTLLRFQVMTLRGTLFN